MSYKLEKPYTNRQYADFVVEHQGMNFQETDMAVYFLEPNEMMQDGVPVINPNYEEEQAQAERERIAKLNLTGADVERGIYKAKGMDFEDIIAMVESQTLTPNPLPEGEGVSPIDIKALKIELKAKNFYRGNPYVDAVGTLLGFTKEQLDKFFQTNDYTYLLPIEDVNNSDDTEDQNADVTTETDTEIVDNFSADVNNEPAEEQDSEAVNPVVEDTTGNIKQDTT